MIRRGTRAQISSACLRMSRLWGKFQVFSLTENMRVGSDPKLQEFDKWLQDAGNGLLRITEEPDIISICKDCVVSVKAETEKEFVAGIESCIE